MLKTLKSIEEIQQFIHEHEITALYISQPNCSVCMALYPKVQELFFQFPKIQVINADIIQVPEVGGMFSVFTAPTLLLFLDGKEILRRAGIFSLELLEQDLQKLYESYFV